MSFPSELPSLRAAFKSAASGQSLIQELRSETRMPIMPVRPQGDKISRAWGVSPLVEAGRVVLPSEAPWLNDFIEEVTSFPTAPHDDQVDAFTQALAYLRGSGFDSATFQTMAAQQRAYHDQWRRSVGYGQMIMNSRDLETLEDGPTARGGNIRYTNSGRFSRIRGAW